MITTLSELIAHTESANHLHALRYEPAYRPSASNVQKCIEANRPMSRVTAETICASSIGLYQILFDNVYSLGYTGTVLDWWKSPDLQLEFFNRYCLRNNIDYTLQEILTDIKKRQNFAARYNGPGGRVIYAERLMNIYEQLKDK